ncbi:MAG: trehalose-phosphatase, partial [Armatimonadetes bacterium]|nr:trehalose-phosphatase [Armatimonadota bacterium]
LLLMHFWHIPWPAWDVFRICPQRAELLDGLLGNDLLAFQHPRHVVHFLECAARELGAHVDRDEGVVDYEGRLIHVEAFPISVDFAALDRTARSRACERWMARLERRYNLAGRFVAVGVDRLDYTKGIPERLRALDLFFRRFPRYRGRLVFIQKCAPSRTQIKAYRDLQDRVEEGILRLNAAYGTGDWQPVIYMPRPRPLAGMAALYRAADLCVVSSLQDGMNLVAKEFVACQVEPRGVLVLSELAGARDELPWAIPINPYDAESVADALVQAIEMPAEERLTRMTHLRAYVSEHNIYAWMEQHLRAALHLLAARAASPWLLDHTAQIRTELGERPRAILLDFDGTLAPIVASPELAALPEEVKSTLAHLARISRTLVAVISGRSLHDIRQRVGVEGLVYAGNHGLEIDIRGSVWTLPEAEPARELITEACRRLRRRLHSIPGVVIEHKGLTASIHYRQTPHPRVEAVRVAVLEEADRLATSIVVRQGKQVLELRPQVAWDKGAAARWMLTRVFGERWPSRVGVIYIGDDRTDEDAFMALREDAVTIKVGAGSYPTAARYIAEHVDEVGRFLQILAREAARQVTSDP